MDQVVNRIYRYILVHDHGIAPCPAHGLITLATCKPTIRRMARPGDWVLGFRPGSMERGLLLWGGLVQQTVVQGIYERSYRGRPDALYRERPDGSFDRIDPSYHPSEEEKRRDLSGPVLIFDPTASVYLDGQPIPLPDDLAHLAAAGRGHRVNGTRLNDAIRLEKWLRSLVKLDRRRGTRTVQAKGVRKRC